jgi:hypothetical protein
MNYKFIKFIILIVVLSTVLFKPLHSISKEVIYQGITIAPSYSYYLSGRTDRVKGYIIKIDNVKELKNPGLTLIANELDLEKEAYVVVNGNTYDIPKIPGGLPGKIIVPLDIEHLQEGINEIEYFMRTNSNGYEVLDTRIEKVIENKAKVVGQTYRVLARGREPTIKDFDFVMSYKNEYKRKEKDIPGWVNRTIRFYRAGVDFEHLDRMFEMFKEAHINLIAVGIPRNKDSEEYIKTEKFIDRCHSNGIKVTSFHSLGGINLRDVIMNPELKNWLCRDEYDMFRWRQPGKVFLADVNNTEYKNEMLKEAEIAIDIGVDEIYYDYAIGGVGDVIEFFSEVRELCEKKGKNLSIYGNCKGNILVDDMCDITKSEGTEEAGIWDGEWVHNIAQSRFYYSTGDGWKPYRSKYEGADPGVPNPGAHDVREGMKYGWKRPIAEAYAFQSHFAIAEAGEKLRDGWILKNNDIAMDIWNGICQYYGFIDENKEFYNDVITLSKVGLLAPPQIPSFEVSLRRVPLYNALAELNVMYDVLLLPRINIDILKRYRAILIADIPWISESQLKVIKEYVKNGGKIYTVGSSDELRELADIYSPVSIVDEIEKEAKRNEFLSNIGNLSGKPLISVAGSKYVLANVVKKKNEDEIILHFVNYSETVSNLNVKVNLEGFIDEINNIYLLSPDSTPKELNNLIVNGDKAEFTIPRLDIYSLVVID